MTMRSLFPFALLGSLALALPAIGAPHLEPMPDVFRYTSGVDEIGPHLTKVEARRFGVGDADGDGRADVVVGMEVDTGVVAAPKRSRIEVYLGLGDGRFSFGGRYELGASVTSRDLDLGRAVVGEFDGEPGADVAAVTGAGGVLVLHGFAPGATPSFGGETILTPRDPAIDIAAADIDGDGARDLVVLERRAAGGGAVSVYGGRGVRRMERVELSAGMRPAVFAAGDLDADGRPEVAVGHGGDGMSAVVDDALVVLWNRTRAGRKPEFSLQGLRGTPAADIAIGRFEADTPDADVAVLAAEAAGAYPFVRISDGGTLSDERPQASPGLVLRIAAGDLDGNGAASHDLLGYNDDDGALHAWYNTEALATFSLDVSTFSAAPQFADFALADINGDGLADLLVLSDRGAAKQYDTALSVRLNLGSTN